MDTSSFALIWLTLSKSWHSCASVDRFFLDSCTQGMYAEVKDTISLG